MVPPPTGAAAPTIAVIGSGPSGCYIAQFLRKRWREAEITIFDRLTLPYGLVRYGVAPDHHGTRAVARQFDRLFERDGVRFVGDTEIGAGSALTVETIRAAFDVVVLATGLHADRPLTCPGASLPEVYGSGRLTRLINGHPDERVDGLRLGERVTIVGHGNVSIDLLRLFLTAPDALAALGIDAGVVDAIRTVRHIDIVGRSMPPAAKFDTAMVRELDRIPDVSFRSDALDHDAVAALVSGSPTDAGRTVHFRFGWIPEAVVEARTATGAETVAGMTFRASDGGDAVLALDTDSVCTAIGFAEAETALLRRGDHESESADLSTGHLDVGLYCVGWLRRGPRGTIPENRADARMVADVIAEAVDSGELPVGKPGFSSVATLLAAASAAPSAAPSALAPTPDPTIHDLVKELQ